MRGSRARTPEKIIRETIRPAVGLMPYQAPQSGAALAFKGDLTTPLTKFLLAVYRTWWEATHHSSNNQSTLPG